jgi:hypothetical protein
MGLLKRIKASYDTFLFRSAARPYHTGKAVGGKSAKFELTFNTVSVHGRDYALTGKHRQEGKGNTVAALLGSMIISGHSAIMTTGQVINAVSAEPISAS